MHGKSHKNIVECAGIALVNKGRIFLINPLFNGIIQQPGIPKGHVEEHETPQNAAIREFKEETGIDLQGKRLEFLCYVFARIDENTEKKVIVYKVDGDGDEKFCGSNMAENGEPENIGGGYMPLDYAEKVITVYQKPIIERLKERKFISSFKGFVKRFNWI